MENRLVSFISVMVFTTNVGNVRRRTRRPAPKERPRRSNVHRTNRWLLSQRCGPWVGGALLIVKFSLTH
ncbi:Hypothetical protein SMAX5B_019269 [Scophthalmus maximus]|uniref:Uncharacterized protein n=1 Tax=Scophthalmus maximus TaxID=52904 RepID=A0A2U9B2Y7_SCOMX|nr:Hypothetical protein SMAX5B_019269 [Scophthalmus maximus]